MIYIYVVYVYNSSVNKDLYLTVSQKSAIFIDFSLVSPFLA